ncbi:hypothetical protein KSF73_05575 [Burkholderiaceae bacterium DAT-1]|nr:hypothetical protein [Burkholderiaceae bacterium DAT-1]
MKNSKRTVAVCVMTGMVGLAAYPLISPLLDVSPAFNSLLHAIWIALFAGIELIGVYLHFKHTNKD